MCETITADMSRAMESLRMAVAELQTADVIFWLKGRISKVLDIAKCQTGAEWAESMEEVIHLKEAIKRLEYSILVGRSQTDRSH